MRAVNRFNVTHFWNPHGLRIPNWYGTCLVMKIFTIGLPAECVLTTGKAKNILSEKKYFWRTLSKDLQKSENVKN